ncbi:MAG: RpiB/LacA/LacB family sugar-phosphate isomerase, partial [Chloroflexi bacterium]|nr:RpiB/LacA/LacB family sugar-phosphate isomerase [Chloroflexota bacterium]
MRVAIAADHAGYALKTVLVERLRADGYAVLDLGADDDAPSDYPDHARAVAEAIIREEVARGMLVCGSGAGAALAASKFPGVRAALCHDTYTARQSVEHDDANVLALGARVVGPELAVGLARTWLASRFSGDERYAQR